MHLHRRALAGVLVAALAMSAAACSDDDDDTAETGSGSGSGTEEETRPAGESTEAAEVVARDYGFDAPESVAPGTKLSLRNEGQEPHELVAILIPSGENRSVEELVALPEEELGAVFGGEPEPATVILAATGQTDTPGAVVGDGTLTEPGRYALVCFIPMGSTDDVLEGDGPPDSDAPPHVTQGMFAELTVE